MFVNVSVAESTGERNALERRDMSAIWMRRILLVVLCAATGAWAQAPKPVIMPFPLEFKRVPSGFGKEDKEALQREYVRLLRQSGAFTPDFAKSDLAMKELKRQDCEREDECLAQLATKAEALYGIYSSVDYTLEGAVVATGRVVRDDGKVASTTQTVKLAKGRDPFKDIAKNALVALFSQLKVNELAAVRPVEPPKDNTKVTDPIRTNVNEPPPPLPPLEVVDSGAGQRDAGKAILVTGLGVGVVGGVLAGVGGAIGHGVPKEANNDVSDRNVANAALGRTMTTVGFIGAGVGAVVAIVGAVVWGTAKPPPVQASVSPTAGGAVVQFGGTF